MIPRTKRHGEPQCHADRWAPLRAIGELQVNLAEFSTDVRGKELEDHFRAPRMELTDAACARPDQCLQGESGQARMGLVIGH